MAPPTGGSQPVVKVRRPYDEVRDDDGTRVLVDRLWPRGLTKDQVHHHEWCKEVAPSSELRQWYGHEADRFGEFAERYRAELEEPERSAALDHLRQLADQGPLTLLTATRDTSISAAAVLADLLGTSGTSGTIDE